MATPVSTVSTILSLSYFNSLSAFLSSLIMLAQGALAFLSRPLVSALSSWVFCSKCLWHTHSIAVIKSTFGRLLGAMAKFGPLDRRDFWACVRHVLDKLTTHLFVLLLLWDWLLPLLLLYVSCTRLPLLVVCALILLLSLSLLLNLLVNLLDLFTYLSLTMINLDSLTLVMNLVHFNCVVGTVTKENNISWSYVGLSSHLKKSTVVGESLSVFKPMFCFGEYFNCCM